MRGNPNAIDALPDARQWRDRHFCSSKRSLRPRVSMSKGADPTNDARGQASINTFVRQAAAFSTLVFVSRGLARARATIDVASARYFSTHATIYTPIQL